MQSEIPEDVMKAAQDAFAKLADTYGSSAAMVFPIARAIMTERERHVSTILTGEMIEAAKSAYSECEFRTDEQVNSSITLIVRAALEAALSTDAEPAAWQPRYKQEVIDHLRTVSDDVSEYAMTVFPTKEQAEEYGHGGHDVRPLYAEPVKTAPAVAVKALEWRNVDETSNDVWDCVTDLADGYSIARWWLDDRREEVGHFEVEELGEDQFGSLEEAQAAAQTHYAARILSALSTQVQDVAGELSRINEMMDGGDDEGSPILPEFKDGWSVEAKVEACLHLLEKRRDVIEGFTAKENWGDDPAQDERWNAGLDFAMLQLCKVLKVDPQSINWDCATETLEGDAQSQIHKVLAAASPASKHGDAE